MMLIMESKSEKEMAATLRAARTMTEEDVRLATAEHDRYDLTPSEWAATHLGNHGEAGH